MLSTAARALARSWPALLAWFLAGWTARFLLLELAGWAGNEIPLVGQLILPIAVIARLASYVAMFLVLRDALPQLRRLDAAEVGPRRTFLARWAGAVSAAILPFFVIYAAWGMIGEDRLDYASAALDQANFFDGTSSTPLDDSISVWSLSVVAVAFAGRWVLQRYAARLPRWTAAISAYLEAVWVLVAALVIGKLLAGVPGWIGTRRMFAPVAELVAQLRDDYAWFAATGDGLSSLLALAGDAVFQPLAWIALAGVVYAVARRSAPPPPGSRAAQVRATVTANWTRLPRWTRAGLTAVTGGFQERWLPIAGSIRLIWGAGPLLLGGYLLAYALLDALGGWGAVWTLRALGPHELLFWKGVDEPVELLFLAIVIPCQLALVAAAYDTALGRARESELSSPERAGSAEPAEAPPA